MVKPDKNSDCIQTSKFKNYMMLGFGWLGLGKLIIYYWIHTNCFNFDYISTGKNLKKMAQLYLTFIFEGQVKKNFY